MIKLNSYIKCALASISVLVGATIYANNYKGVRTGLDVYLKTKPGISEDFWGLSASGVTTNKEYMCFATMVSNDYKNVFANINSIATNETERLLVLATGWQFGEEFYLLCLEELADLGLKGYFTPFEIHWYSLYNFNSTYANIMRLRCRESRIKKLARKLMRVEPDRSEDYEEILSGISYEVYLRDKRAGLWD